MASDLEAVWKLGYSIAELWGASRPVSRGTSAVAADHLMLWGILSIVEYQVNRGAGHNYLRARLANEDWVAIGYTKNAEGRGELVRVPPLPNAQFGKRESAVGNASGHYVDVRVVNAALVKDAA